MRYLEIIGELAAGRDVILRPHGNSMTPRIKSGQMIALSPIQLHSVQKGDVVLAKVRGRYYIHLVSAVAEDGRVQISNNHGHVNGWSRQVYGKVTRIEG